MSQQITSWLDLAEHSIFHGLTANEVAELGLQYKPGSSFSVLADAINTMGPRLSHEGVALGRMVILKKHLAGNLSDEIDL